MHFPYPRCKRRSPRRIHPKHGNDNPSATLRAAAPRAPENLGGRQPPHIDSSMGSKGVPNASRYIAHNYRLRRARNAPHYRGTFRWSRIVFEDFHHQGRVIRGNNARLKHTQEPDLALGLAKCSRGVHRHIGVEPLTRGCDGWKGRADLERDAVEDQLPAARRLDGASHASVVEGVDR